MIMLKTFEQTKQLWLQASHFNFPNLTGIYYVINNTFRTTCNVTLYTRSESTASRQRRNFEQLEQTLV